ncbi:amino acid permease [Vibrio sp. M60_M31a]
MTALVFSSMVGAGIFSLPQNMAEVAGLNAMIVGWTITGVGILLLAGCFLHLSRLKPDLDGGIYAYAREGFGDLAGFSFCMGLLVVCDDRRCRLPCRRALLRSALL